MELQTTFHGKTIESPQSYCGKNSSMFKVGGVTFYFSYKTCIAFETPEGEQVILKNYWSNTTGKHLNAINPDKKIRVNQLTFDKLIAPYI